MEFNKTKSALESKFYDLVTKVMPQTGLDLYDMEFNSSNSTLTVYIIDPKTNSALIEDCVQVDRAFSEPFEELDWIPENIRLEVSSPGVYRKIRTLNHFKVAVNERISVTLNKKIKDENLSKKILSSNPLVGELKQVKDENIVLNIEGSEVQISFDDIKKANLEPKL